MLLQEVDIKLCRLFLEPLYNYRAVDLLSVIMQLFKKHFYVLPYVEVEKEGVLFLNKLK
jgi:hypothetical protein